MWNRPLCCRSVNTLRFALMSMGAVPGICLNRSMDPPISLPDLFPVLFRCDPGRPSAPALSRRLFDSRSLPTSVPRPLRCPIDRQLSAGADCGSSVFTAVDQVQSSVIFNFFFMNQKRMVNGVHNNISMALSILRPETKTPKTFCRLQSH